MTSVFSHRTLADIVSERTESSRVFERFGLDYCCHGDRTLDEACQAAGLQTATLADLLDAVAVAPDDAWSELPIPALADHIVAIHHAYAREELPFLDALATKVLGVHGDRHPELGAVRDLVRELRADFELHMDKEERVLFPAIHAIYAGTRDFPFGTIANPVRMMGVEHDRAGELLSALRQATGAYRVPDDACASYRALYERLAAFEHDTHLHVHKENYRLFPAAIAEEGRDPKESR
ncbi:MAG TPA: iron-sulfur cluster repair di-iron protein [Acidimicrobiia bacterium]|nr:iron-sulfur cluster repair di-iron protein [Acidimicrobiia bacterium]